MRKRKRDEQSEKSRTPDQAVVRALRDHFPGVTMTESRLMGDGNG